MANYGVVSTNVAQMNTALDSVLPQATAQLGQNPGWVLINIGANNLGNGTTQAAFEASYLAAIDKIHAAFPNMQIYMMQPWWRGFDATATAMVTWISNVQAARPTFTHTGPNENVWLKGADNGVTLTSDGVHYNAAGATEVVNQWKTALGY